MTTVVSKASRRNNSKFTTSANTIEDPLGLLKSSYRHWRDFLNADGEWDWEPNQENIDRVIGCFHNFGDQSAPSVERVNRLILAVDRSKSLVESSLAWTSPHVGGSGKATDQTRGEQWRLVIAWGGLEELIKSVMGGVKTLRPGTIERFLSACRATDFTPMAPPKPTAKLRAWRQGYAESNGLNILRYLGSEKHAQEQFKKWLVKGNPIERRVDALYLAQAMRHVTAHGALSATKVREWGMRPALDRLVQEIGHVCAAAIEQLVTSAGVVEEIGKNRSDDGRIWALSVRQPHAEAIIRGIKSVDLRARPTETRGSIYIYAASSRHTVAEERRLMKEYGIEDMQPKDLPHGLVVGRVNLHDCKETRGEFSWHFKNPTRRKRYKRPDRAPRSTWFVPFK